MKGVTEGNSNNCGVCNEKFEERLEIFLTARLRQLHRAAVEEGTAAMICQRHEQQPASVDYAVFLKQCSHTRILTEK